MLIIKKATYNKIGCYYFLTKKFIKTYQNLQVAILRPLEALH